MGSPERERGKIHFKKKRLSKHDKLDMAYQALSPSLQGDTLGEHFKDDEMKNLWRLRKSRIDDIEKRRKS